MTGLQILTLTALVLAGIASAFLLLGSQTRTILAALAVQYMLVFYFVSLVWPLEMAFTKLISGGMACLILGIAIRENRSSLPSQWLKEGSLGPAGRIFRLLSAAIIILVVSSASSALSQWLPEIPQPVSWASLLFVGIGLLHLGFTAHPFRIVIGLLTIISGFEIAYAALESSTLVAGLLAAGNLGLAFVGAYLVMASLEEEPA